MPKVHFRVGKVTAYLRGHVWYLCYFEHGKRHRPRVGTDRDAARQLAAQINGQLATGAPAALSFEPIPVAELRTRWLEHHEQVLRSSVGSITRYRTATDHLLRYLELHPVRHASLFQASHAEAFVRHLRAIRVSPNGHPNTAKRPLLDKGVRYVLECCRALFNFAAKRRHLSPYAENPFAVLDLDRIPVETRRTVELFSSEQEHAFLAACDDWQLPVFATLLLTGLRPGELCHLLLPDDLDLESGILRVRNKPRLGWQVKTRNQRDIPLMPELTAALRRHLSGRKEGPVFRRRLWGEARCPFDATPLAAERELDRRVAAKEAVSGVPVTRADRNRLARRLWREMGVVREDRVRLEFIRVASEIGLSDQTAPKIFRHQFATALQEGRVDPLVRNLLMGHAAAGERSAGHGLGMTAMYTHTRPETIREQLVAALAERPAALAARTWAAKAATLSGRA
jgi:integrase